MTAKSLTRKGEIALKKGCSDGLALFEEASSLAPKNGDLLYRQAESLYEYGADLDCVSALRLSNKKFKRATLYLEPDFQAEMLWGHCLYTLGELQDAPHFFKAAKEHYQKAEPLAEKSDLFDLYWSLATCETKLSEISEEPIDLQNCLATFAKAEPLKKKAPASFWIDYSHATLLLATKFQDKTLYVKTIQRLKRALSIQETSEGWSLLAETLEGLYEIAFEEEYLTKALEAYEKAHVLDPCDDELLATHAELLYQATLHTHDIRYATDALNKCHSAYALNAKDPQILALWGKCLALYGELSDNFSMIVRGEEKVKEALTIDENEPETLIALAAVHFAFGRYHNHIESYFYSIEKCQEALSIDRSCAQGWELLGKNYLTLGILDEDTDESLRLATKFFYKALQLKFSPLTLYFNALAFAKLGDFLQSEKILTSSVAQFEHLFSLNKNFPYLHLDWYFAYGTALDLLGHFVEEEKTYQDALEIFASIYSIDPNFPHIGHQLALSLTHVGEQSSDRTLLQKALALYETELKKEPENDELLLDFGIALIHVSELAYETQERISAYAQAKKVLLASAKLGNTQCFYQLAALHSLMGENAMALLFLQKSKSCHALPPLDQLLEDDWLEGVRSTPGFQEFASSLEQTNLK